MHYIEKAITDKGTVDVDNCIGTHETFEKFKQYFNYIKGQTLKPPTFLIFENRMTKFVGEPTELEQWIGFRFKENVSFGVTMQYVDEQPKNTMKYVQNFEHP